MDFRTLDQMFELATNQARAVQTLFSYNCISMPTFACARSTMREHIKTILTGCVPYIDENGITRIAEDKPACVEAFRTIALYSAHMDAACNALDCISAQDLNRCLDKLELPPEIPEHSHEPIKVELVQHVKQDQ